MIEVRYIDKHCLNSKLVKEELLVNEINNLIKNELEIVTLIKRD